VVQRKPGGDREMVDILSLVLHHDDQAVLCTVELALEAGVPTKTHVLNLLHRLLDGKPTDQPTDQPDVNPPATLSLSMKPEANVARLMMGCAPRKEPAMRHDPAGAALIIMLRSLKMPGMAQAVQDLLDQGAPAFEAAMPILSQLLKAEMAEREVRLIAYHMKAARFPAYKDLSAFDFAASEIRQALVRQLHRCEFLDGAENVVLIGGPGTGKTNVATALGIQAIEHHRKRVRFFSTVELVNALEQEKA